MQSSILHFAYEYYMFEGIPAYPSPFIPIDFTLLNWMDISDSARFRKEKHYAPRQSDLQSGLEYYSVGTGAQGIVLRCEYWDGQRFHEEKTQVSEVALSFTEWQAGISQKGNSLIEKARRRLNAFESPILEEDKDFGQIYVCKQIGHTNAQASEQYFNLPLMIEYRLDFEMMRIIEQKEFIIISEYEEENILFRHLRLKQWGILQEEEIHPDTFNPNVTTVWKR